MMLSLKGNVMNGPIGKQMVDTLVESQANVEVIKCGIKIKSLFKLRYVLSPRDLPKQMHLFNEFIFWLIILILYLFQMILKFFDIFLKMKDLTSSEAFLVIYTFTLSSVFQFLKCLFKENLDCFSINLHLMIKIHSYFEGFNKS